MVWQMHFQRLYERGHGGEQQDAAVDDRAMAAHFRLHLLYIVDRLQARDENLGMHQSII